MKLLSNTFLLLMAVVTSSTATAPVKTSNVMAVQKGGALTLKGVTTANSIAQVPPKKGATIPPKGAVPPKKGATIPPKGATKMPGPAPAESPTEAPEEEPAKCYSDDVCKKACLDEREVCHTAAKYGTEEEDPAAVEKCKDATAECMQKELPAVMVIEEEEEGTVLTMVA
jgi:hypothetical protein